MSRTIVILQPGYLPWLGFFDQMYKSDLFVVYDDVQFDKEGWRNRNRIKTAQGWTWVTVPVLLSGKDKPLVKDVLIDNKKNWPRKHLQTIRQNYSKAPFFEKYFSLFEDIYVQSWKYLIDLDMALIRLIMSQLGLERDLVFSSKLGIAGESTERLVAICKHLGATRFYEGAAGQDYLDESLFEAQNITVDYQDYDHPVYEQRYGEFVPYLSVIDLLFNHGEDSLDILVNPE